MQLSVIIPVTIKLIIHYNYKTFIINIKPLYPFKTNEQSINSESRKSTVTSYITTRSLYSSKFRSSRQSSRRQRDTWAQVYLRSFRFIHTSFRSTELIISDIFLIISSLIMLRLTVPINKKTYPRQASRLITPQFSFITSSSLSWLPDRTPPDATCAVRTLSVARVHARASACNLTRSTNCCNAEGDGGMTAGGALGGPIVKSRS